MICVKYKAWSGVGNQESFWTDGVIGVKAHRLEKLRFTEGMKNHAVTVNPRESAGEVT